MWEIELRYTWSLIPSSYSYRALFLLISLWVSGSISSFILSTPHDADTDMTGTPFTSALLSSHNVHPLPPRNRPKSPQNEDFALLFLTVVNVAASKRAIIVR